MATHTYGNPRRRVWLMVALGVAVLLAWMVWLTVRHTSDTSARAAARSHETKAVSSLSAQASVASQGKALAKDVQTQCKTDAAFRVDNPTLCVQASVLATVTPSAIPGPAGPAGRGIRAVNSVGGHLILVYTDGTGQDVGRFVGPSGKSGPSGKAGRGITAQAIVGGHLIATYTDGAVADLGQVVGAAGTNGAPGADGVSVTDVAETDDFHLVVTYSDGRTQDVGALPAGPKGDKGDPGVNGTNGVDGTNGADGKDGLPPAAIVIEVPNGLMGTATETCTPQGDAGPGAQPTYSCAG